VTDTIRNYDLKFRPVPHGVIVSCELYTMGFPVCYGSQKHHECKEGERSGRWWHVILHVQTCSGRNNIIPFMRLPNTDSAPNMHVTLPRNQILYLTWSRVPSTLLRYGVTVRGNVTSVYPTLASQAFSSSSIGTGERESELVKQFILRCYQMQGSYSRGDNGVKYEYEALG
jgi:hypothetical protein